MVGQGGRDYFRGARPFQYALVNTLGLAFWRVVCYKLTIDMSSPIKGQWAQTPVVDRCNKLECLDTKVGVYKKKGVTMSTKTETLNNTSSTDITERKRAEEALRLFSHSVESSVDGMAMGDLNGKITYVNKAFARMFGYSKEELIGQEIVFIWSEGEIPKLKEAIKATMEGGWTGELIGKRKDGELFPVALSSSRVVDNKGNVIAIMANHRDITERKRAEQRIEHLNRVLQAIRNVNQLIAREKDRDRLIKGICNNLVETRGYYNAWLVILDESGGLVTTAEAGLGKDFLPLVEQLNRGELPDCTRRALRQSEVVETKDPASTCTDCPLSGKYAGREATQAPSKS